MRPTSQAEDDAMDGPDPNRKGLPKCPRCGDIAYRPQPVTTRLEKFRCGGCHRTLNYCLCPDISEEPA